MPREPLDAEALALRPKRFGGQWIPEDDVLEVVACSAPNLRYLELPADHCKGIEQFSNLEHIILTGTKGPAECDLSLLPKLRALSTTWSRGLTGLSSLRKLEHLALHYWKATDLSELSAALPTLRSLTLKACSVTDLSNLATGQQLELLWITSTRRNMLVDCLLGMRNLRSLILDGVLLRGPETSTGTVANSLEWVILGGAGQMPSLSWLQGARPRAVVLRGSSRVADGKLRWLLDAGTGWISIDQGISAYDVTRNELPSGDGISAPQNPHKNPLRIVGVN